MYGLILVKSCSVWLEGKQGVESLALSALSSCSEHESSEGTELTVERVCRVKGQFYLIANVSHTLEAVWSLEAVFTVT